MVMECACILDSCSYVMYACSNVLFNFVSTGLDDLKTLLKADYDSHPINQLCTADGPSRFVYRSFKSAKPLEPIRMRFDIMARQYNNDLFYQVWHSWIKKAAQENRELNIEDIIDVIWRPAFKECESTILDGLKDGSIKLQAVDNYFRRYNNTETVKTHLHRLHRGVESCYGRSSPPNCPQWIRNAVSRVHQYWTLGQYASAAQTVLELKEKLKLTGDFHEMYTIAEQVLCGIF